MSSDKAVLQENDSLPLASNTSNSAKADPAVVEGLKDRVPEPLPAPESETFDETDEAEGLPPVSDHPAAAEVATEAEVEAAKTAGEYYIGLWYDKPNYGCPYCSFSTIEGSGAVELHILSEIDSGKLTHMAALEPKEA